MDETESRRIIRQINEIAQLLGLFSFICCDEGQTFAIYTSRKGRIWLTFKQYAPYSFSTAVEVERPGTTPGMLDSLAVACVAHYNKLRGGGALGDTWMVAASLHDAVGPSKAWIRAYWERAAGDGIEYDQAPPADPTEDPDAKEVVNQSLEEPPLGEVVLPGGGPTSPEPQGETDNGYTLHSEGSDTLATARPGEGVGHPLAKSRRRNPQRDE